MKRPFWFSMLAGIAVVLAVGWVIGANTGPRTARADVADVETDTAAEDPETPPASAIQPGGACSVAEAGDVAAGMAQQGESTMSKKIEKTDVEWREQLDGMEFYVLRQKGTERAFTGEYHDHKGDGVYTCAGCGAPLFDSETKFESGSGWPSYWQPVADERVNLVEDNSLGMRRVEVVCSRCEGHLGHVFNDGPQPTGLRYCINSASLEFKPREADAAKE